MPPTSARMGKRIPVAREPWLVKREEPASDRTTRGRQELKRLSKALRQTLHVNEKIAADDAARRLGG